jgi:hypothetical protein
MPTFFLPDVDAAIQQFGHEIAERHRVIEEALKALKEHRIDEVIRILTSFNRKKQQAK